ncbi:MAG: hypothetical protein GW848_10985, partial [Rhodoferax sp.]|nr:hypothetical protein [Rhodoferax sp.]
MEISPVLGRDTLGERQRSNTRLALKLGLVALFFVGFGFAMVPIYNVFCEVTGLNGKTNDVAAVVDKNT